MIPVPYPGKVCGYNVAAMIISQANYKCTVDQDNTVYKKPAVPLNETSSILYPYTVFDISYMIQYGKMNLNLQYCKGPTSSQPTNRTLTSRLHACLQHQLLDPKVHNLLLLETLRIKTAVSAQI